MLSSESQFKTIYLLGAGASKPAGIPTITEMTEGFLAHPTHMPLFETMIIALDPKETLPDDINTISRITQMHFSKLDLEYMMTLVLNLEEESSRSLFETRYPELKTITRSRLKEIKNLISSYIRAECEKIQVSSVDYLWPLLGLSGDGRMDIFTMNYDATIEVFCERANIKYTDGFGPYWNSNLFDQSDVRVFKMHGSLYWLRTESGKFIRVPVKGLPIHHVRYLTDEEVSEMMIYPALQKDKQSEVYLWLFRKFIDQLGNCDTCVVIGYSLRDREIVENIYDALYRNPKLWLVIVNPTASSIRLEKFGHLDDAIFSRILAFDIGTREAVTDRRLHEILSKLEAARKQEEQNFRSQSRTTWRLDREWSWLVDRYIELEHHDRLAWVYEKISTQKFTRVVGAPGEIIENHLGRKSLLYIANFYSRKDVKGISKWIRVFIDYCAAYEYAYFQRSESLQPHNPVNAKDRPFWAYMVDIDPKVWTNDELRTYAQILGGNTTNEKLLSALTKFERTIDVMSFKSGLIESQAVYSTTEFLDIFNNEDLGLHKWACSISSYLDQPDLNTKQQDRISHRNM
jgi:hypothetical protein